MGDLSTTGSLTSPCEFDTATLLNSGKVLVVGGDGEAAYLSSWEIYDLSRGK